MTARDAYQHGWVNVQEAMLSGRIQYLGLCCLHRTHGRCDVELDPNDAGCKTKVCLEARNVKQTAPNDEHPLLVATLEEFGCDRSASLETTRCFYAVSLLIWMLSVSG